MSSFWSRRVPTAPNQQQKQDTRGQRPQTDNTKTQHQQRNNNENTIKDKKNEGENKNDEEIKQWGVSQPQSIDKPSEKDIERSKQQYEFLHKNNLFEPQEESKHREKVQNSQNHQQQNWAVNECENMQLGIGAKKLAQVQMFTFGSYRQGVHNSGGDIDVQCVGPKFITREQFFENFGKVIQNDENVHEFAAIPDAYVPVMKFTYKNIDIDQLYASINRNSLPDVLDIHDDMILRNLDEKSVLSLNGCRVTDTILSTVPNIENFRLTLRCIKLWASRRGVYSNKLGYPGGVAWAILTARICQLYPYATSQQLVRHFFRVTSLWKWPSPIHLKYPTLDSPLGMVVWTEQRNGRTDLMPIITPAYPCMNSTYNICQTTKYHLLREFERGSKITQELFCTDDITDERVREILNELIDDIQFFYMYKYFLNIVIETIDDKQMEIWYGWIESQIRKFYIRLETIPGLLLHPFPKSFDDTNSKDIAIDIQTDASSSPPPITLKKHLYIGQEFHLDVATSASRQINTEPYEEKQPKNKRSRVSIDLSGPTSEFILNINRFRNKSDGMNMNINFLKNSQLQNFVFKDGINPFKKKRRMATVEPPNIIDSSIATPENDDSTTATTTATHE